MPDELPRGVTAEDFEGVLSDKYVGLFFGVDDNDPTLIKKLVGTLVEGQTGFNDDCFVATYQAGDSLFPQGWPVKDIAIFVVLSGVFAVKHLYRGTDKETLIVGFDTSGIVIGDVEYLIKDVPNELIPRGVSQGPGNTQVRNSGAANATVTAMTKSEVMVIRGEAQQMVMQNVVVMRNMMRLLALKLIRRSARGDALQVLKLPDVVAVLLQRLSLPTNRGGIGVTTLPNTGEKWPAGYDNRLNCHIRHRDFADALGVSLQTINTIFATLNKRGWVNYGKGGDIYLSDAFVSLDEGTRVKVVEEFAIWW